MNHKVTFDDIIGYEKEKEELLEVKDYLLNTKKYEDNGARIPKGILLIGASGVGKTLIAKALANQINVPFLSYGDERKENGEILDLSELFDKARKESPCIIFIDEIDKLCNDTNYDPFSEMENDSQLVRSLLTQMDGFKENSGILVLATANSTYRINKSLLRSGRFDRTIIIKMPSKDERRLLFEFYSKNKKIDNDVDFNKLSSRTSGLSCADIDNVMNDAVLMSIREGKTAISNSNIETALDRICFSSATLTRLPKEVMEKIAVHEIGHTVCAIICGNGDSISKVSIESRGSAIGFNRFYEEDDELYYGNVTKKEVFKNLIMCYGGAASELLRYKEISTGCSHDIETARQYGKTMITNLEIGYINKYLGLSTLHGFKSSENSLNRIERGINRNLKRAFIKAKKIIKNNKELFYKLYYKLLENNVLYKEDIIDIVQSIDRYRSYNLVIS